MMAATEESEAGHGQSIPRRTAGFRQKAVGPRKKSGTTRAEAARGPGCDAGSLSDWARKTDAAGPAPDANPFRTAEDLRRPRRENEILSKASARAMRDAELAELMFVSATVKTTILTIAH